MIVINDEVNWPYECLFKEKKINPPCIEEPYYYYYCTLMKTECQINGAKLSAFVLSAFKTNI